MVASNRLKGTGNFRGALRKSSRSLSHLLMSFLYIVLSAAFSLHVCQSFKQYESKSRLITQQHHRDLRPPIFWRIRPKRVRRAAPPNLGRRCWHRSTVNTQASVRSGTAPCLRTEACLARDQYRQTDAGQIIYRYLGLHFSSVS